MQNYSNTGFFKDVPMQRYVLDPCIEPSLNASIATTLITRAPLHAWADHPRLNPDWEPETSAVSAIGSAAHNLLLERSLDNVQLIEANSFRTKAAQELRDKALEAGKIPLLAKELDRVRAMVALVSKEATKVPELAENKRGNTEVTAVRRVENFDFDPMEIMGKKPHFERCRFDWIAADCSLIVDYKTMPDAEPLKFIRTRMCQEGKDIQAEIECQICEAVSGIRPQFIWILQEQKSPYACSFVRFTESASEHAANKLHYARKLWRKCSIENNWPSFPLTCVNAFPPTFMLRQWEEFLAEKGLIYSSDEVQS